MTPAELGVWLQEEESQSLGQASDLRETVGHLAQEKMPNRILVARATNRSKTGDMTR